mmetsp:Transcript_29813/g.91488  ORF Transcript_29813/g.91488 Transcript_29813/m.91488 type:complete len:376 (+) Transcript_29813:28-1155(+)
MHLVLLCSLVISLRVRAAAASALEADEPLVHSSILPHDASSALPSAPLSSLAPAPHSRRERSFKHLGSQPAHAGGTQVQGGMEAGIGHRESWGDTARTLPPDRVRQTGAKATSSLSAAHGAAWTPAYAHHPPGHEVQSGEQLAARRNHDSTAASRAQLAAVLTEASLHAVCNGNCPDTLLPYMPYFSRVVSTILLSPAGLRLTRQLKFMSKAQLKEVFAAALSTADVKSAVADLATFAAPDITLHIGLPRELRHEIFDAYEQAVSEHVVNFFCGQRWADAITGRDSVDAALQGFAAAVAVDANRYGVDPVSIDGFPTKLRMQAPTVELYMEKTFNVMMHVLTASVVAHQSASFIGELFKHRPRNVKSPQHGGTIN